MVVVIAILTLVITLLPTYPAEVTEYRVHTDSHGVEQMVEIIGEREDRISLLDVATKGFTFERYVGSGYYGKGGYCDPLGMPTIGLCYINETWEAEPSFLYLYLPLFLAVVFGGLASWKVVDLIRSRREKA
jgi:hypothetical protein